MRLSASSILRMSLRSRSRVRSSRLNSSSCVARSLGSGKFAASSFMWVTVRSTSTMRSRFQPWRMLRKWSSCSLLMYCSPRLAMYGLTSRGPARRLPGSSPSLSSPSVPAAALWARTGVSWGLGAGGVTAIGAAGRRGFFISATGSPGASVACTAFALRGTVGVLLRACPTTTTLARALSGLRPSALRAAGRLAAFLPLGDLAAGLLTGINGSSKNGTRLVKNARLYRPTPACTGFPAPFSFLVSGGPWPPPARAID